VARDPTANQLKELRRVYKAAGGDENFVRWVGMARRGLKKPKTKPLAKKRGRKQTDDGALLQEAVLHLIRADRDGVSADDALSQWLEPRYKALGDAKPDKRSGLGPNVEATIHRIKRKLMAADAQECARAWHKLQPAANMWPPLKKTPRRT
jgi:hypothetical protein